MTTPGIPLGKLDPIAKVSLIIAPIIVVVANFLLPTNGVSPVDPEDSTTFIAKLGADADIAQIYMIAILLGMVLWTRAILGLWRIAPEGASKQRLGVGLIGATAALAMWGIVVGLGLAEASIAGKLIDAKAAVAASGGAPEAITAATNAGLVASTLHSAYLGVFQATASVAFLVLIPIGGGIAISGIVNKYFGWVLTLIGVATVILVQAMPVKTEEGITTFGIIAVIWGVVFLAMGLIIAREDMN